MELMPICCVDVVLFHDNKILLVKRKNEPAKGEWWVPGGRVYKNEKLEEAAKRKIFEEVGLKVKVNKMIGIYETIFEKSAFGKIDGGTHTINIGFLVEAEDKNLKIKLDKTSAEYKWIDKIDESLPEYVKRVIFDSGVFN